MTDSPHPEPASNRARVVFLMALAVLALGLIGAYALVGAAEPASAAPTERDDPSGDWHASSAAAQTSLIELYTSEGCSSCPPADKWLSGLRDETGLWRDVVPIAFHVTYWDRLGWKDPYASKAGTDRQHRYADTWGARNVYTPCFVVNGEAWRPTLLNSTPGLVDDQRPGVLAASLNGQRLTVRFSRAPDYRLPRLLQVHSAILGSGLESQVASGENAGNTLAHDFVVIHWQTHALSGRDGDYSASIELPLVDPMGADRLAIAVWINRAGELAPLQATGNWLSDAQAAPLILTPKAE